MESSKVVYLLKGCFKREYSHDLVVSNASSVLNWYIHTYSILLQHEAWKKADISISCTKQQLLYLEVIHRPSAHNGRSMVSGVQSTHPLKVANTFQSNNADSG